MSIHRGHAPAAHMSFAAVAVPLLLALFAHARGTGIEPISSTSLEVPPLLAAGHEPSESWSTPKLLHTLSGTGETEMWAPGELDPWVSESGLLASKASKGSARGSRAGKAFTSAGKKEIDAANAAKNDGVNKCENCEIDVVPGQKSQSGVSPPTNQRERDHIVPKSKGGDGSPSNGQVLCRECNLEKSDKTP